MSTSAANLEKAFNRVLPSANGSPIGFFSRATATIEEVCDIAERDANSESISREDRRLLGGMYGIGLNLVFAAKLLADSALEWPEYSVRQDELLNNRAVKFIDEETRNEFFGILLAHAERDIQRYWHEGKKAQADNAAVDKDIERLRAMITEMDRTPGGQELKSMQDELQRLRGEEALLQSQLQVSGRNAKLLTGLCLVKGIDPNSEIPVRDSAENAREQKPKNPPRFKAVITRPYHENQ